MSQSERLQNDRAEIAAATARYLEQGGRITRLDNRSSPVEHLCWKGEARQRKAADLSYISEHKRAKPARRPRTQAEANARRDRQLKNATEASSKAKRARREALAPKVRELADKCPVSQIARQLGISAGMVRRIGRDHDITLNKSRGAMPAKEVEA